MRGTRIASLRKYVTADGRVYLSGEMTRVTRLLIVENKEKTDENDADFFAYVVPNRGPRPLDEELIED